jgi:hypothetical protein
MNNPLLVIRVTELNQPIVVSFCLVYPDGNGECWQLRLSSVLPQYPVNLNKLYFIFSGPNSGHDSVRSTFKKYIFNLKLVHTVVIIRQIEIEPFIIYVWEIS